MVTKFVKVAHVDDIPPGERLWYDFDDETVVIFNVNGEYYCIADVCTHDGGPLEDGELEGYEVECPRHGAHFDVRSGEALTFPAVVPVPTYNLKIEDDHIYVQAPED